LGIPLPLGLYPAHKLQEFQKFQNVSQGQAIKKLIGLLKLIKLLKVLEVSKCFPKDDVTKKLIFKRTSTLRSFRMS
jgi:hypothetical protein